MLPFFLLVTAIKIRTIPAMNIFSELTQAELAISRTYPQEATLRLSIHRPAVLFTGQLAGNHVRGAMILTLNATLPNSVVAGYTLRFASPYQPKWKYIRIKQVINATQIMVAENGFEWTSGQLVQVVKERIPWSLYPRIAEDKVFYKDYNIQYSTQIGEGQNEFTSPVVIQSDYTSKMLIAGAASFDLDCTDSYVTCPSHIVKGLEATYGEDGLLITREGGAPVYDLNGDLIINPGEHPLLNQDGTPQLSGQGNLILAVWGEKEILPFGEVVTYPNGRPKYKAEGDTVDNLIKSVIWACEGGTITDATKAQTVVTYTSAGAHHRQCTATDLNGISYTSYRLDFVETESTLFRDFDVNQVRLQNGQLTLRIPAQNVVADGNDLPLFRLNTFVVLWADMLYGGVSTDIRGNVLFAGYVRSFTIEVDMAKGTSIATVNLSSVQDILDRYYMFSAVLNAVEEPRYWYEYARWLTIGRAVHHLLRWHTNLLEITNCYGLLDNETLIKYADFKAGSVRQQVESLSYSNGIFAHLIADKTGQLYFKQDPQMLGDIVRNQLPIVLTLTPKDITGTYNYSFEEEDALVQTRASGMLWDNEQGTPFLSVAPTFSPEQMGTGMGKAQRLALDSQEQVNEICGRLHAKGNEPVRSVPRLTMQGIATFVDVGQIYIIGWADPFLYGRKFVIKDYFITHKDGNLTISITPELLAEGAVGTTEAYIKPGVPDDQTCPPEDTGRQEIEVIIDPVAAQLYSAGDTYSTQQMQNGVWKAVPENSGGANWLAVDYHYLKEVNQILTDNSGASLNFNYATKVKFYEARNSGIYHWTYEDKYHQVTIPSPTTWDMPDIGAVRFIWCDINLFVEGELWALGTWTTAGLARCSIAHSLDAGVTWTWLTLNFGDVILDEVIAIGANVDKTTGDGVWVTVWAEIEGVPQLRALKRTASIISSIIDLGPCEKEELQNRIFIAWPYCGAGVQWPFFHGRMNIPELGICQIVSAGQEGLGIVENTWEPQLCSSMRVSGTSTAETIILDAVKSL